MERCSRECFVCVSRVWLRLSVAFPSCSGRAGCEMRLFSRAAACWHSDVLPYLPSPEPARIAWLLCWQRFLGLVFCALGLGGAGRWQLRAGGQRTQRARASAAAGCPPFPFVLREVSGSVFKLNSHVRVTTTIFISSRWPNVMNYRRLKPRS